MSGSAHKRKYCLLSTKEQALRVLDARMDGTFGPPSIGPKTRKESRFAKHGQAAGDQHHGFAQLEKIAKEQRTQKKRVSIFEDIG